MGARLNSKIMKTVFVLVPIIIVAIGLFLFSILPKSRTVNMEGSVEISTIPYFSQINGTVTEVFVRTGEAVKAGDPLAGLDSTQIDNEIEQLKATLIIKNSTLKELRKDPNIDTIDAAKKSAQDNVLVCEETLAAAQRSLTNAKQDLSMQQQLFAESFISQRELKDYEIAVEESASAVTIARAQLASAKSTVDTIEYPEKSANQIEAAQADLRLTELQIESLEGSKKNYSLKALNDGVVVNKSIDVGSNVLAGQTLFELSNEEDRYFVFYLPEEYIKGVGFEDKLNLYRLNSNTIIGTATVCYIDWKAIYTPKDFESSSNKNKRSIKIKAFIDSEERLNVGEAIVTKIDNKE